jgi:micrococcal nuclease
MKPFRVPPSVAPRARFGRGRRALGGSIVALAVAVLGWYWPAPNHDSDRSASVSAGRGSSERPSAGRHSAPNESSPGALQSSPNSPAAQSSSSYRLIGTVALVSDGDTVRFRSGTENHRIRLDSIDSPELEHGPDQPGQHFGQEARDHLANWVSGKTLTAQCYGRDQYDRDLCDLLTDDGESATHEMVKTGYAWAYTAARGRYLRDTSLTALQADARGAGRGLWADANPMQPWQWRYDCWRQHRC